MSKKKIFFGLLASFLLLVLLFVLWNLAPLDLKSSNLDLPEAKVSANGAIEFQFNHWLSTESEEAVFEISPEISGSLEVSGGTLRFVPDENFEVGQTYEVLLKSGVKSLFGRSFDEELRFEFVAQALPSVLLAVPNEVTSPETKVTLMFDRPMTALSSYDETEAKGFPLEVSPAVKGRMKWVGTSTLQFIPEERLDFSTAYTFRVPKGTASLEGGTLGEDFVLEFETTRIARLGSLSESVVADEAYILRFNQAVDLSSLADALEVEDEDGRELSMDLVYAETEEGEDIETRVELRPSRGDWGYDRTYYLSMDSGIMGLEGDLGTEKGVSRFEFSAKAFLESYALQNNASSFGPNRNLWFRFHQEIDLESFQNNFELSDGVAFDLSYGEMCDPDWEPEESPDEECDKIEDRRHVIVDPTETLENSKQYSYTLKDDLKALNGEKYLRNNLSIEFTVVDPLEIYEVYKPNNETSYKGFCVYSNLALDFTPEDDEDDLGFNMTPAARGQLRARDVYAETIPFNHSCYREDLFSNGSRGFATYVTANMDPNTEYTLEFTTDFQDRYGQHLAESESYSYSTTALLSEDLFARLVQKEFYAVAQPKPHTTTVFEFQNVFDFDLELCRISSEKFVEVDTQYEREREPNKWSSDYGWYTFEPSTSQCVDYWVLPKTLEQNYWLKQYYEVDLTEELGTEFVPGHYLIRAKVDRYDSVPAQLLSTSDLGVFAKRSEDDLLLWATDLSTGEPIPGVEFRLYSRTGALLDGRMTSNSQGIAERALNELPFEYVQANWQGESMVMDVDWSDGIDPWNYSLRYSDYQDYSNVFIYTDRPLYQPTHEVFFKGLLRFDEDAQLSLPEESKVWVTVNDPRGKRIYKEEHEVSTLGSFDASLVLDESAPLGTYWLRACLDYDEEDEYCRGSGTSEAFYVEEYRKPEYEVNVSFDEESFVNGEAMKASVQADYFFGAPVTEADVTWNITAQNYFFDEYDEEWYSFGNYDDFGYCYWRGCSYADERLDSGEGVLDETGYWNFDYELELEEPESKIMTLSVTVQDQNNQNVTGRASTILHRANLYVGLRKKDYVVAAGEPMTIETIAVDAEGTPISGQRFELELFKMEWNTVKKKNIDGSYYWENEREDVLVESKSITVGFDGKQDQAFTVDEGGSYLVKATGKDASGNETVSSLSYYVTSKEWVHWPQDNNNILDLELDAFEYKPGDTAQLLIQSPYIDVKALITMERAGLLSHELIDVTSNTELYDIEVTEDMIPNTYISVLLVKEGDEENPPDFKMGYANLVVDRSSKALDIEVAPDQEYYGPGEQVTLQVQTKNSVGQAVSAELSVAVVDESLLALKANPPKDLLEYFYNERSLGVSTFGTLTNLLERIDLSNLKNSKGGGGGDDSVEPRGDFEDTAYWEATVQTDETGRAELSFMLPDNLTTWNIEVVGHTETSLFGVEEIEIISQKPLMLRSSLPLFLRYEDEVQLGGIVHNFTEKKASFEVQLMAEGLVLHDKATRSVTLEAGASEKLLWKATAPSDLAVQEVQVTMSAKGEGYEDAWVQTLPIYSYSTPESVASSAYVDEDSAREEILIPASADPSLGSFKVSTGATLATYLTGGIENLLLYPYLCTEQSISRLMAGVILQNSLKVPGFEDSIDYNFTEFNSLVESTIQRLYSYQRYDGGWGYWSGSQESYPSLTAYVLYALNQLESAGYSVDGDVQNNGLRYLRDYMKDEENNKYKTSYWANNRAYMLFIFSEMGQGDLELANNLYVHRDLLSPAYTAYLAMALQGSGGSADRIAELMTTLENEILINSRGAYLPHRGGSSFGMMTDARSTAVLIQALTRLDLDHPMMPRLIEWLVASRSEGSWATTQENISAVMALTEYLNASDETSADYVAKVLLNDESLLSYELSPETVLERHEAEAELSSLQLGEPANELLLEKDGEGRLYYDMLLEYYLPVDEVKARDEGFSIERSYYAVADEEMEFPLRKAKAGDTLHGHLTIVVPEQRNLVSVEVPLPAGFELVNFEFDNVDQALLGKGESAPSTYPGYYYGRSVWTQKELRSDRLLLFADRLNPGVYEYDYYVQVTSEGDFHHPPAVVEEMYFPENFGRSQGEWLEVTR